MVENISADPYFSQKIIIWASITADKYFNRQYFNRKLIVPLLEFFSPGSNYFQKKKKK